MTQSTTRDLLDKINRYGLLVSNHALAHVQRLPEAGRLEQHAEQTYHEIVDALLQLPGSDLREQRVLPTDLIADYVPDSSGRYRIYRIGDLLVTRIDDAIAGDVFEQRLYRASWLDGAGAEWMLTDTFGAGEAPDDVDASIVWIDGEAYVCEQARDVVARFVGESDPVADAVHEIGGSVVDASPEATAR